MAGKHEQMALQLLTSSDASQPLDAAKLISKLSQFPFLEGIQVECSTGDDFVVDALNARPYEASFKEVRGEVHCVIDPLFGPEERARRYHVASFHAFSDLVWKAVCEYESWVQYGEENEPCPVDAQWHNKWEAGYRKACEAILCKTTGYTLQAYTELQERLGLLCSAAGTSLYGNKKRGRKVKPDPAISEFHQAKADHDEVARVDSEEGIKGARRVTMAQLAEFMYENKSNYPNATRVLLNEISEPCCREHWKDLGAIVAKNLRRQVPPKEL